MKQEAEDKLRARAEMVRDGVFLAGLLALCSGVYIEFGMGWALITLGAACLTAILLPVVIRNAAPKPGS